MTLSHRLYYGVVNALPYVVLGVGVLSVLLAAITFFTYPTNTPGSAWWALVLGGFLVWAGRNAVSDRRAAREEDEAPPEHP